MEGEALAYEHCVDVGEAAIGRQAFDVIRRVVRLAGILDNYLQDQTINYGEPPSIYAMFGDEVG